MNKKYSFLLLIPFALTSCNAFNSIPGPQGEQGDRGITGEQGDQGPQGEQGDQGKTGPAGLSGPRGEQGDPGEKGPLGPQGDQGPQGEQGDKGPTGDVGSDATVEISENKTWIVNGVDTEQTVVGPQGSPGATGPDGSEGMKGDQGSAISPGPRVRFLHNEGGFVSCENSNVKVGEDVKFNIVPYEGFYIYGYEVNGVQHIFEDDEEKTSFTTKMVNDELIVKGLFKRPNKDYAEKIYFLGEPCEGKTDNRTTRNYYFKSENDLFIFSYDVYCMRHSTSGLMFGISADHDATLVNDTLSYEGPVLNGLYKIEMNFYGGGFSIINSITIHIDDENTLFINDSNSEEYNMQSLVFEAPEGTFYKNPKFSITTDMSFFSLLSMTFYVLDIDPNIY